VTRRNDSSSDARPPLVRRLGRSIAVLLILQLMGGMLLSPHRTFYPVYLQDLGYSALLISTLATARRVAGLLASLLGGTASDLLGRKRTLLLGQVGFLLTSVAFLVRPVGLTGALWTLRRALDAGRPRSGPEHARQPELPDRRRPGGRVRPADGAL